MRLDPTTRGWLRKRRLVMALSSFMERGRLCTEVECLRRSEVAVVVYVRRRPIEAGLCAAHHRELLGELERRGREQPDGTVILDRRRIGTSRIVTDDEVIDGPLAGERDDN